MNISRIINSLEKKEKFNYKSFEEKYSTRDKLLEEHKYYYISKKDEISFEILTKKNDYGKELKDIKNEIYIDQKINLSIFKNNYKTINTYLRRFFFEGYDTNDNSIIDEYFTDLSKIYEFKKQQLNYI